MWSQLKRCFLRAPDGESHRLFDVEIDSTGDGYPFVRRVFFRRSLTEIATLSHARVRSIDTRARSISVDRFDTAEAVSQPSLDGAVLLDRDVLDALILDIP